MYTERSFTAPSSADGTAIQEDGHPEAKYSVPSFTGHNEHDDSIPTLSFGNASSLEFPENSALNGNLFGLTLKTNYDGYSQFSDQKAKKEKGSTSFFRGMRPLSGRQRVQKRLDPPTPVIQEDNSFENDAPNTIRTENSKAKLVRHLSPHKVEYEGETVKMDNKEKSFQTFPSGDKAEDQTMPELSNELSEKFNLSAEIKASFGNNRSLPPRKWTPKEDEMLKAAVKVHGGKQWKEIAKLVAGRSHVQCLQRWNKVLKPGLRKGPWTPEEDGLLIGLVNSEACDFDSVNWGELSMKVPGRSAKQCRERWSYNLDPRIKKGKWSELEDKILVEAQATFGNRWAHISTLFQGRTENAVKTRFKSLLRAKKKQWTPSEDEAIVKYQGLYGNKWAMIAEHLPNRSKNAVMKRFKFLVAQSKDETSAPKVSAVSRVRKSLLRGKKNQWSPDEDDTILKYHAALGNNWGAIAKHLPNRTKSAVMKRHKFLVAQNNGSSKVTPNPSSLPPSTDSENQDEWAPHEDDIIIRYLSFEGDKVLAISKFLPYRSENDILKRLNFLADSTQNLVISSLEREGEPSEHINPGSFKTEIPELSPLRQNIFESENENERQRFESISSLSLSEKSKEIPRQGQAWQPMDMTEPDLLPNYRMSSVGGNGEELYQGFPSVLLPEATE
eukprot:CAMPEP_0184034232 /NCGR_PEP_ID=MMETSP0955-20130417/4339_1 /TAXON_ID=627963 /ORGANISM="Aplanochytrium sp, Strain PBS07" /LENGTH=668 /DNA_ID=CAMNT_0026320853 /DNA_START=199 /DNA_END=2205 /DNA_ORIENTATION=-